MASFDDELAQLIDSMPADGELAAAAPVSAPAPASATTANAGSPEAPPIAAPETTNAAPVDVPDPTLAAYLGEVESPPSHEAPTAESPVAPTAAPAAGGAATVDSNAILELARSNAALAAAVAASRNPAPAQPETPAPVVDPVPTFDPGDTKLTDEESAAYAAARPVVDKLVNAALARYHDQVVRPINETAATLRAEARALAERQVSAEDSAFLGAVQAAVPEFTRIVKDSAWKSYLNNAAPLSGGRRTLADVLASAVAERNTNAVKEIFAGFKAPAQAAPPPTSVAPGKPRAAAVSSIAPARGAGPRLALSKLARATEDWSKGRITTQQYETVESAFMQAELEGRVNHDA